MDAAEVTFDSAYPNCGKVIQEGFKVLQNWSQTPVGLNYLSESFKTCAPLTSKAEAEALINWVLDGLTGMAMLDYPYSTDYGISLPAWPVNTTCKIFVDDVKKGVPVGQAFADAIGTFYNNTKNNTCYNITTDIPDWGGCCGWDYLACTEVYLPAATRNDSIFPYQPWNFTNDNLTCEQQFNVGIRADWPVIQWGNLYEVNAQDGSNIIFSNGLLDPWHTSGVLENRSDTLIAIVIPEAGHHLDLWAPNKADPIYVTEARKREQTIIAGWLSDYWHKSV